MNEQLKIIGALAMDLKRVSMGKYRCSENVANRFWQEVIKRKSEIKITKTPKYIENLLNNLEREKDFETLLMYSTLLQNYSQTKSTQSQSSA